MKQIVLKEQMSRWILLWLTVGWGFGGRVAQAMVKPPTGQRDLILVIARYDPKLYRLVGQQPQPFGVAQFYSPKAIVADPENQCFYVFDEPRLANQTRNIWRIVLVDAGSIRERTEEVYTGLRYPPGHPRHSDHPQQRKTKSVVNGGVFILHPAGHFEDLTFKTPNHGSGPMRRPHGIAQWSDDTYLIADPEMVVKGITGTGGLFLLNLDGSRQARWPFGQRLRPLGVAILRDAGPVAQATPTGQIELAALAGTHMSGKITRITSASLERKGQGGGLMGPQWEAQSAQHSQSRLRAVFENARWSVGPDGVLLFCGSGATPLTTGTTLVMQGKITAFEGMLSASASYKRQSMFDTQLGSLDARLYSAEPGTVTIDIKVNVFTKTERLKAAFEQTMSLKGN
jgi:hypothetical protein